MRRYYLTHHELCLILLPVETEFNSLEEKVAQFVSLCERRRAEIKVLKLQLAAARSEANRLHEKIHSATARLEGLLARLPG